MGLAEHHIGTIERVAINIEPSKRVAFYERALRDIYGNKDLDGEGMRVAQDYFLKRIADQKQAIGELTGVSYSH